MASELKQLIAQLKAKLATVNKRNSLLSQFTVETEELLRLSKQFRALKMEHECRKLLGRKVPYRVPVKVLYREEE